MSARRRYTLKRRRHVIDISEIKPGDQVTVQDKDRNTAIGEVRGSSDQLWVDAFGMKVKFAQTNRSGEMRATPGLRLVGHVPSMFPDA